MTRTSDAPSRASIRREDLADCSEAGRGGVIAGRSSPNRVAVGLVGAAVVALVFGAVVPVIADAMDQGPGTVAIGPQQVEPTADVAAVEVADDQASSLLAIGETESAEAPVDKERDAGADRTTTSSSSTATQAETGGGGGTGIRAGAAPASAQAAPSRSRDGISGAGGGGDSSEADDGGDGGDGAERGADHDPIDGAGGRGLDAATEI